MSKLRRFTIGSIAILCILHIAAFWLLLMAPNTFWKLTDWLRRVICS